MAQLCARGIAGQRKCPFLQHYTNSANTLISFSACLGVPFAVVSRSSLVAMLQPPHNVDKGGARANTSNITAAKAGPRQHRAQS